MRRGKSSKVSSLAIQHPSPVFDSRKFEKVFLEAVHRPEEHFRELLDSLPAAIYTTDTAGRITFYNRAAVELSGREPRLGADQWCVNWRLLLPDGTPLPHDQCPMTVALREDRPIRDVEIIAERPDGTRLNLLPYPTPLHDSTGGLIGAVNMLVDITDRKRTEQAVQELNETLEQRVAERTSQLTQAFNQLGVSEERFRLLVEGVTDCAIFMLDPNGFVTSWNAGARRIKGYTADEIIGGHFSQFYTEGWRVRKDGTTFWANAVLDAIHDTDGRLIGFAKITRDLTEKRETEEQL